MQKCNNCHLLETYETFQFNKQGVCNVCVQHETKRMR